MKINIKKLFIIVLFIGLVASTVGIIYSISQSSKEDKKSLYKVYTGTYIYNTVEPLKTGSTITNRRVITLYENGKCEMTSQRDQGLLEDKYNFTCKSFEVVEAGKIILKGNGMNGYNTRSAELATLTKSQLKVEGYKGTFYKNSLR